LLDGEHGVESLICPRNQQPTQSFGWFPLTVYGSLMAIRRAIATAGAGTLEATTISPPLDPTCTPRRSLRRHYSDWPPLSFSATRSQSHVRSRCARQCGELVRGLF